MDSSAFPITLKALARTMLLAGGLLCGFRNRAEGQSAASPDTVIVPSGGLHLRALLWRPQGAGPFPAILLTHGSGGRTFNRPLGELARAFRHRGYVFLFLFRRGQGLSADEGASATELLERQQADSGAPAYNRLQVRLLETEQLEDGLAGLKFLRSLPQVDAQRVGVVGHSYGGSLALLLAERDSALKVAIDFAGGAASWDRSPELRARLLAAVRRSIVPTFFIHAANDYSVAPAKVLAAEMERVGRLPRLKIYPPFGLSAADGHGFLYLAVAVWEKDVFAFLSEHVGPVRGPQRKGDTNTRKPK